MQWRKYEIININKYKEEMDRIIAGNKFSELIKFIKDNDLSDIFKFNDIITVDSKEGIYSQLNMPLNYPFTRSEKFLINEFRKIINKRELSDKDITKLGLNNSLMVARILNLNESDIEKRYKTIKNLF